MEVLRHTGIRIEELTELSHHSLIQYRLPSTGQLVPLLQIAPSKTDTERLLVISPELADVLSTIVARVRGSGGRRGRRGCPGVGTVRNTTGEIIPPTPTPTPTPTTATTATLGPVARPRPPTNGRGSGRSRTSSTCSTRSPVSARTARG